MYLYRLRSGAVGAHVLVGPISIEEREPEEIYSCFA